MRQIGLAGVIRGRKVKTTVSNPAVPCPRDKVNRQFRSPRPTQRAGLVYYSDKGIQYVSFRYTERQAEAGVEPSVGNVGDSHDNALAETTNGLLKAEVIHRRGPWRHAEAVKFATLDLVHWFNNRHLLEPIGNIPPAEVEVSYCKRLNELI